jgi:hypothetical protein
MLIFYGDIKNPDGIYENREFYIFDYNNSYPNPKTLYVIPVT